MKDCIFFEKGQPAKLVKIGRGDQPFSVNKVDGTEITVSPYAHIISNLEYYIAHDDRAGPDEDVINEAILFLSPEPNYLSF